MLEIDDLQRMDSSDEYPIALPVDDIDLEVRDWVPAMLGYTRRNRIPGLSAPEVGLGKALFVTNVPGDMMRVFINPTIKVYGKRINAERREHVSIHAYNLKDEQFLLSTTKGYYEGREEIGKVVAQVVQDMYAITSSPS